MSVAPIVTAVIGVLKPRMFIVTFVPMFAVVGVTLADGAPNMVSVAVAVSIGRCVASPNVTFTV